MTPKNKFKLKSKFDPAGDQPNAIEKITQGIKEDFKDQTLLGVTGSGKTFTMASVIENVQKPTLIISHNKTLAAQLYSEFKTFFPDNGVHYFVSYYDYYQPEAYVPRRDLFIEKETDINEEIERYRNAATQALLSREDVIIVASVSCIYGLGNPEDYLSLSRNLEIQKSYNREKFLRHLGDLQYERSEYDFYPGLYRVRGDTIDIYTAADNFAVRVEFFGDVIDSIKIINPISGEIESTPKKLTIFPAKHFVTPYEALIEAIPDIEKELKERIRFFKDNNDEVKAQRIEQRARYDIEMLQETGYCSGIENYSRFIEKRAPGSAPSTLLDYYPDDWLLIIDESHMTIPQIRGMHNGDRARKKTLVEHGFRLPSALDNRPLKFQEFRKRINQSVYTSATPSDFEIKQSKAAALKSDISTGVVEQIIRPTGLLDPMVYIRPTEEEKKDDLITDLRKNKMKFQLEQLLKIEVGNQIDDVIAEVQKTIKKGQRSLITTLTKRMAEDLASYLSEINIKVQYLHSEIDTVERVEILRDLRLGKYDVVVGVNLLREGLDLPEVSSIFILDSDKEGFLRSEVSLIQTTGRAARHSEGRVIMYADKVTGSMKNAIEETERRREIQSEYNKKHNIRPKSIQKDITDQLERKEKKEETVMEDFGKRIESFSVLSPRERKKLLEELEVQMLIYSDMLEFEKAAEIRDNIDRLKGK